MAKKNMIRSIRKGSVQWNEEDRLALVTLLAKAGYAVMIRRQPIPEQAGKVNAKQEYVVEYWEEADT